MLYFLFFCSGLSGLIYQVVWVRVFGNVFGNTIYSASLVVAVFMLGLGLGSYIVGSWADDRYAQRPDSLLRAYGYFELFIAFLALGISALLPQLGRVSALVSSYSRDSTGWYVLSTSSYLMRVAIAIALLTPVTVLMGGTLTLLIRHLVRSDVELGGWRIARLYAANTLGAAVGCFLTDFLLVPSYGLRGAQMIAVTLNIVAGVGALWLARTVRSVRLPSFARATTKRATARRQADVGNSPDETWRTMTLIAVALALSGFAGMGMEILWFRHFTMLLGGFRAVFSLLLTIILIGIGAGSLVSGILTRRNVRAAEWLMVVQGLFVASTLLGLAAANARNIEAVVMADPSYLALSGRAVDAVSGAASGWSRALRELWFNARPILLEVGVPALLMGFSFPLANAMIQRAEQSVGRRAGLLYLANTFGAVCGSLAAGFLLLPKIGIQGSATILVLAAALAVVPLKMWTGIISGAARLPSTFSSSSAVMAAACLFWLTLPSDYLISRAVPPLNNERQLTLSEGVNEVVAVTELPGQRRRLLTNGHPMSSTTPLSQRYMRALAHIPLLSIGNAQNVLVIGFGVGNTTHAATLHTSVRRVEVADLSRDILADAGYFKDVNRDVLSDPRVVVYVNDGRHHLQMQPRASYDLITLEPPPVGYAGVAALYSSDFYHLARSRLKPGGYMSQWLPAYQMPSETTLAMVRAFIDVFPQSVLISGAEADLLLVGANDSRIEIDPERLAASLSNAPAVRADLQRLDLGTVREIAGMFVGSAQTLAEATRDSTPVSDDHPIQEYGVRSLLNFGESVPASVVDLKQVAAWCPKCFAGGRTVPLVEGLDTYLALLDRAYNGSPAELARARHLSDRQRRVIAGSAYLGTIVPESAELHNVLGIALAQRGNVDEAIAEFREALRQDPDLARTHWHLGAALAARGSRAEAIAHLRRSVQLDSNDAQVQYDLGVLLALEGHIDEAIDRFRVALTLNPGFDEARRTLEIALKNRS